MQLPALLRVLHEIAPLSLAEEWDNTGLLLEPAKATEIESLLLTIDLTRSVLEEAMALGAQMIVAYHPPIFSGLKRITREDRTGDAVLTLIENGIAVYSPHTALDAVEGGVNDWLSSVFAISSATAIEPKGERLGKAENRRIGQGRRLELANELDLGTVVGMLKGHLGLSHLRVAAARGNPTIRSVALCPGAGASVVTKVSADLYLTGEMRHHDVLAAAETGTHVILTEHTNSERGYLPALQRALLDRLPELSVTLATQDRDPLATT